MAQTWNDAIHRKVQELLNDEDFGWWKARDLGQNVVELRTRFNQDHQSLRGKASTEVEYEALLSSTLDAWSEASGKDIADLLRQTADLCIKKQHDYGHGNILAFGHDGIIVRISDKWARIQNLEGKESALENEPLTDSYLDLVGYCLIGLMLCDGTFELELV